MYEAIAMNDADRLAGAQKRLRERLLFWMPEEGDYGSTLLYGFTASRWDGTHVCDKAEPSMELVVQGKKRFVAAGREFCAEAGWLMRGPAPAGEGRKVAVSASHPYLSISLSLDRDILHKLEYAPDITFDCEIDEHAVHAAVADYRTLDAFSRLIHLMERPELFFLLSPLIVREIHYRALTAGGSAKPVIHGSGIL